jgi:hypothetical protein
MSNFEQDVYPSKKSPSIYNGRCFTIAGEVFKRPKLIVPFNTPKSVVSTTQSYVKVFIQETKKETEFLSTHKILVTPREEQKSPHSLKTPREDQKLSREEQKSPHSLKTPRYSKLVRQTPRRSIKQPDSTKNLYEQLGEMFYTRTDGTYGPCEICNKTKTTYPIHLNKFRRLHRFVCQDNSCKKKCYSELIHEAINEIDFNL